MTKHIPMISIRHIPMDTILANLESLGFPSVAEQVAMHEFTAAFRLLNDCASMIDSQEDVDAYEQADTLVLVAFAQYRNF